MNLESSKKYKYVSVWMAAAFGVWIWCFRHFLSGEVAFTSDAISYYNHIKFFIDQMLLGVYPLWDPYFSDGVTNEFFLRRFGSFNPFYLIILALRFCGVEHVHAYTSFLAFYWFIGAVGFFVLAKSLLQDSRSAFVAFLLFYFSVLGDRLFDSYILLVLIPMIWFFAFLVRFFQTSQSVHFIGMTCALMILATTYIPLYFGVILLIIGFLAALIFPEKILPCLQTKMSFCKKRWWVVLICLFALVVSLLPGIQMYKSSVAGDFVMPIRSNTVEQGHALSVGKSAVTSWAVMEEIVYSSVFSNLKRFKFAVLYLPCFAFIVFSLGFWTKFNRRMLLYVVAMLVFFLMSAPGLTSLQEFLFQNISIFKLFRNLHWFLWLAIIPLLILFIAEQFDQLLNDFAKGDKKKPLRLVWILTVHLIFLFAVMRGGDVILTTYVCIGLSLLFWGLVCLAGMGKNNVWFYLAVLMVIVVQPIEVFSYLSDNSVKKAGPFIYERDYDHQTFQKLGEKSSSLQRGSLYYALKAYEEPYMRIDPNVFYNYTYTRFKAYDHAFLAPKNKDPLFWKKVEDIMSRHLNIALVEAKKNEPFTFDNGSKMLHALELIDNSQQFEVLNFDANQISLITNFSKEKFLVVSSAYHPHWEVKINGKQDEVYQTNGAFQGVRLPAGANRVQFRFNSKLVQWNLFLLSIFYGMFVFLGFSYFYSSNRTSSYD